MTINHRAEALRLVEESNGVLRPNDEGYCEADRMLAEAQIHATLARDEEQTATTADLREALQSFRRRFNDTREAVAAHIAKGLTSREKDRWQAARDLAQALDEAHCNLDDLVDARLADNGWDTKTPWTHPAPLIRSDDPWAPKPDVTAQVPEPVRRVLAGHLAEMLLAPTEGDVQKWARGIAYELKREGADLTGDIEAHIRDLTLGRDPSEPPF